jgi:hypothetical protein
MGRFWRARRQWEAALFRHHRVKGSSPIVSNAYINHQPISSLGYLMKKQVYLLTIT